MSRGCLLKDWEHERETQGSRLFQWERMFEGQTKPKGGSVEFETNL